MNKEQKKFSNVDKDNLTKNRAVLTKTTFIISVMFVIIGAIIGIIVAGTLLKHNTHFSIEWITNYIQAWSSMGEQVTISGKTYGTKYIQEQIGIRLLESMYVIIVSSFVGAAIILPIGLFIKNKLTDKISGDVLKDKILRGTTLMEHQEFAKGQEDMDGYVIVPANKEKKQKEIKISREKETSHINISGATGAGKTVILTRYFEETKKHPKNKNAKWVVHDIKMDWTKYYFNPETDYVLNQDEKIGIKLDLFLHIKNMKDLKSIVNTIIPIPETVKDKTWLQASRSILIGIFSYCIATNNKNIKTVKKLIHLDPDELKELLTGIKGAERAVVNLSTAESTLMSIYLTFAESTEYFELLNDEEDSVESDNVINLNEWVHSKGQSTIFLQNSVKYGESFGKTIAVFVETLANIVLSLSEDKERRIYFFLDEFPTLSRMDSIIKILTLARTKGGVCIIGIQNISQCDVIYSKEIRNTLSGNTGTKIVLTTPDPETSKFFSDQIGQTSTEVTNKTASIGDRDSISFAKNQKLENTVIYSQIQNLPDLHFYLKVPNYGWGFIKTEYLGDKVKENKNYDTKGKGDFFTSTPLNSENDFGTLNETTSNPKGDIDNVLSTLKKKEDKKVVKIRADWGSGKPKKHKVKTEDTEDFSKFNESDEIDIDDLDEEDLDNL